MLEGSVIALYTEDIRIFQKQFIGPVFLGLYISILLPNLILLVPSCVTGNVK